MKALSLALISVLFATACAKEAQTSAPAAEAAAPAAKVEQQTAFLFTLATCLPPSQTIYNDTKRLIFLANMNDEGKGPMDLMFESTPSEDSNNSLGFFVLKGGTLDVGPDGWIVSGRYVSEGNVSTVDSVMPANRPGEQQVAIHFTSKSKDGEIDVTESWTCRVH